MYDDAGATAVPSAIDHELRFGSGEPLSLGVEEELFLVDPATGEELNCSEDVVARAAPPARGSLSPELHACQVELITDVCRTAGEAMEVLAGLRRAVVATGAGVLGSATHPTMAEGAGDVTAKDRYRRIHELLGDAAATPVSGLHVHIGMPDAPTAVRAFNGLRRHLPLLQALGANSPYRHGRDTGLASSREVTMAEWPRSGVPLALADWDDFEERTAVLCRAAEVPDYTYFWWKLRPHPRLGTVEVRAIDVQSDLADTGALVALVHVLAAGAAERSGLGSEPSREILDEGGFRAARYGVEATLPDVDGRLRPVAALLDDVLRRTSTHARELGCEDELSRLPELLRRGGGAGRQRALVAQHGLDALSGALARRSL